MRRVLQLVLVLALLSASTGDAAQRRDHRRRVQLGLASYYGPGFNGDRTASGEVFNQHRLVAAHRTLPLGTIVRVTNRENGRSVVVRIIDRGPYGRNHRRGCIIDLSKAAARRLGSLDDGIVHVRLRVLRFGGGVTANPGAPSR